MKTKSWLISIVLSLAVGAGGGYAIHALQLTKPETNQLPLKAAEESASVGSKFLPEIIASQLESGDFSCPEDDLLTYEACLAFQGTLGIWQRAGLTKHCPDIMGPIQSNHLPPDSQAEKVVITPQAVLDATKSPCFGYLYAINVVNTVPILIRTANRVFQLEAVKNFQEPGSDANLCLSARFGSCGNHTATALGFFEKAGFKARPVEFYYEYEGTRLSHIIPEVWIDGDWRMVDSTFGAYWIDRRPGIQFKLRSTEDILSRRLKTEFYNAALLPYGFYSVVSQTNDFSYISEKADVIRGGSGQITLNLKGKQGSENFMHKPNFIGDNIPDSQSGGIQFRLVSKNAKYRLTVNVSAAAISNGAKAFICIDELCEKYSDDKREYNFNVKDPSKLYLKTDTDVAYAVLKSLDWKVVSN
jgi:hypothetical protein